MKAKRKAWLTPDEDALFSREFELYFNNVRRSNQRAAAHAWRECQRRFPRLQKFTDCHA